MTYFNLLDPQLVRWALNSYYVYQVNIDVEPCDEVIKTTKKKKNRLTLAEISGSHRIMCPKCAAYLNKVQESIQVSLVMKQYVIDSLLNTSKPRVE
jgi:hypothetical protein